MKSNKKIHTFFTDKQDRSGQFVDYGELYVGGSIDNPVIPRPYQKKFLRKHTNTRLLVVGMPTGSGKSKLMKFAMLARMINDPAGKVIISVPKTVIKKSFGKEWIKYKGTHEWDIGYNFCDPTVAKTKKLVNFIKNPQIGLANRVVICSHAALVKAYQELSKNDEMSCLKDTHIIIDEFHHVMYAENDNSAAICNQLGEFVSDVLDLSDESVRLWGLTATFFRGDRQSVLAPSVTDQFEKYMLPLDEHWRENIKHIESFAFDFVIYEPCRLAERMEQIIRKNKKKKIIIYIPRLNSKVLYGTSKTALMTRLHKFCKQLGFKYLDLVDEDDRKHRKEIFDNEDKMKNYDVVFSVDMLNEGTDWPEAEVVIDTVPSGSLVVYVQRFGRLLRDYPGKKHVQYYSFLQHNRIDLDDPDRRRENCSEVFASLAAAMTIQELVMPAKPLEIRGEKSKNTRIGGAPSLFVRAVPDVEDRHKIWEELVKRLAELTDGKVSKTEIKRRIESVLNDRGITHNVTGISDEIIKQWFRAGTTLAGIPASALRRYGFDKVWQLACEGINQFTSSKCGADSLTEVIRIVQSMPLSEARPDLATEWHPEKNGNLTPHDVTCGNHKKVWWKCSEGHEWEAVIKSRAFGRGCPCCSGRRVTPETSLAHKSPNLAKEWHPTKNGDLTPHDVTCGSNKKVWWRCSKGHEWEAVVGYRRGYGCPHCKSLDHKRPDLAKEWHPAKNGDLTPCDVTCGSSKKVWWKCSKDHEWEATCNDRNFGDRCPYCSGRRVLPETSLAHKRPNLAKEWHPTKNGDLTPHDVSCGSHKKVWWRCSKGHEWESVVFNRTRGSGCPECWSKLKKSAK